MSSPKHTVDCEVKENIVFISLGEPVLNLIVLLLRVETLDGSPLPNKFLTIPNCRNLSIECGEVEPYQVELLSAYEACLTFTEDVVVTDLVIKLMAVETWISVPAVITTVVLNREKVDQIVLVREQGREEREAKANVRLAEMQEEQESLKQKLGQTIDHETRLMDDITTYVTKQGDLAKIVNHLAEQLKNLESHQSLNQTIDEW